MIQPGIAITKTALIGAVAVSCTSAELVKCCKVHASQNSHSCSVFHRVQSKAEGIGRRIEGYVGGILEDMAFRSQGVWKRTASMTCAFISSHGATLASYVDMSNWIGSWAGASVYRQNTLASYSPPNLRLFPLFKFLSFQSWSSLVCSTPSFTN